MLLSAPPSYTGEPPFALLGRLILKQEPDLAHQLIRDYFEEARPTATDHSLIPTYFARFCTLQSLQRQEYIGTLRKAALVDTRRLFIAVLLRLYLPQVFNFPDALKRREGWGLLKAIALHFDQGKSVISRNVHEAIRWTKDYEDYAETVFRIYHQMSTHEEAR